MRKSVLGEVPDLWKETYNLVSQVPLGKVTTYGAVAEALGDMVASRFVGLAMSRNDDIVRVPCRRVVQSDGQVGGYTGGGPSKKARLLRGEGIEISGSRIVDLHRYLFTDFRTSHPLKILRRKQLRLKQQLEPGGYRGKIGRVAGVDVAYEDEHAYAAMVTYDFDTGTEVDRVVVEGTARFPYVPTYLAFREIPIIEPLMDHVGEHTVLMYDGNGILHPEGFGIASQVGVVFGLPTVGVAKKLLCGTTGAPDDGNVSSIRVGGRVVGHALRKKKDGNPVFVSAGNKVSVEQAKKIAIRFLQHRVPEPTRMAHIVAESARRATSHK